jgi:hypothetical protein
VEEADVNRSGQVWREMLHENAQCVGLIVDSKPSEYGTPGTHHELVILYSDSSYHTIGGIQTWEENDNTGDWSAYVGLERLA